MSDLDGTMLGDLAIDALERTAFVVAEHADVDFMEELTDCEWYTHISYTGPASGEIYLAGSTGFMTELAASLLGVECDEVRAEVEGMDALRELTNIIGGSVVSKIGGDHCKLSLGLPEAVAATDIPKSFENGQKCTLDSCGERLDITWISTATEASKAA